MFTDRFYHLISVIGVLCLFVCLSVKHCADLHVNIVLLWEIIMAYSVMVWKFLSFLFARLFSQRVHKWLILLSMAETESLWESTSSIKALLPTELYNKSIFPVQRLHFNRFRRLAIGYRMYFLTEVSVTVHVSVTWIEAGSTKRWYSFVPGVDTSSSPVVQPGRKV